MPKRPQIIVKCTYCDADFFKYVSHVRENNFCCKNCYTQWQTGQTLKPTAKITVKCTNCNTEFVKYRHSLRARNFCCKECRLACNRGEKHPQYTNRVTVKCTYCSTAINKYPNQIKKRNFCNKTCRDSYNRTLVGERHPQYKSAIFNCAYCNAEIERRAGTGKRSRNIFCNRACKTAWHKENAIGENAPHWKGGKITVRCAYCETEFQRESDRVKKNKKHFCSHECKSNFGSITIQCAYCNATLRRPVNAVKRRKKQFCNKQCLASWKSSNETGENNHNWKGGYSPYYGPNWRKQQKSARERDAHICQICGKTKEENGRELDVHHIIPFRTFGYIPGENSNYLQANHLDNLKSLCHICHSNQQGTNDL